jgi:hypothetical protein
MKHFTLLPLLLLACWQVAAASLPPAVGPQSAPEPHLLPSPNFEDGYAQPIDYMDYSPGQYTTTRFQARIVTLQQGRKNDDREQQLSGFGIQYGWTRHQWVRNLDNETHIDEEYKREIVVGVPLLLLTVSTLLSAALLAIEIYERVSLNAAAEYNYYLPLDSC